MKKTVDGKTYNTATARLVGEWRSTLSVKSSRWCHEMLFQTGDGDYFLWVCGGSLNGHKSSDGTVYSSKAGITPMPLEKAKAWAQVHMKHEACVKEFGKYGQVA